MSGWKSDPAQAGSPFISQISLLHDLLVLYGEDMVPHSALVKFDQGNVYAEGVLKSSDGGR